MNDLENDYTWSLAVRGTAGAGKSLFARKLLLETSKKEKQILKSLKKQHTLEYHFEYLVSSCTTNIGMKFLGVWRVFLR